MCVAVAGSFHLVQSLQAVCALHPLSDLPSSIGLVNIPLFVHTSCFPTYTSVDMWVASTRRLLGTCYFKWIHKSESLASTLQGYTQKGDYWITWWFHLQELLLRSCNTAFHVGHTPTSNTQGSSLSAFRLYFLFSTGFPFFWSENSILSMP